MQRCPPTRGPEQSAKRQEFEEYKRHLEEEWESLNGELCSTGNWPAAEGPEMLCRWDMHGAPPDILVTNYSMLEYMLIRPIESPIFDMTRAWLKGGDDRVVTLVLDEAHTYTGAKGTEVAHLVRRLKERLGIRPGSNKFRGIATSASIPNIPSAKGDLTAFTSDLFGEPQSSFTLIHAGVSDEEPLERHADSLSLEAFAEFHDTFSHSDPWPSMEALSKSLGLPQPDQREDAQVALYQLLSDNQDLRWVRARTARNATRLSELAQECWPNADPETQERAMAGLLAAGSFARPMPLPDTPPILSMRIHAFFRGLPGFWACLNPNCPEIPREYRGERPVGRIYTDPRPWCSEPHRQALVQERRPHHPQKRDLHRHVGMGNPRQGPCRAGAGGEGVSRHRLQDPVPQGQPPDALPRSEKIPPPPRGKLLPAQWAGQVPQVQPRPVGPGLKSGQFSYYVCQSLMKRGSGACDAPRLNARRFEEMVVEKIRSNILTEGNIREVVKLVDEEMDGVAHEQRVKLETVEAELADVRRRLERLYNLVETTDMDIDDFKPRIREHRERQERLEDAAADARAILSQRRAVLDDVNTIAAYAQDMSEFLNESELIERRAFIETFVKEIVVMPGDALMRYTIPISQSTPKTEVLLGGRFGCDWIRSGGPIGWCADDRQNRL